MGELVREGGFRGGPVAVTVTEQPGVCVPPAEVSGLIWMDCGGVNGVRGRLSLFISCIIFDLFKTSARSQPSSITISVRRPSVLLCVCVSPHRTLQMSSFVIYLNPLALPLYPGLRRRTSFFSDNGSHVRGSD